MKKIVGSMTVLILFATFVCGCSLWGYRQEAAPRNVYKEYLVSDNFEAVSNFEERLVSCSNSVVTIVSCTNLRLNGEYTSVINLYSGVIINPNGYLLTSIQAALLDVFDGGETVQKAANEVYAILPDIYNDKTQYKLKLVDYDSAAGLALYCFYDNFYYFTNETKSSSVEGFQFYSVFSGEEIVTGERCAAIGNSLGNILNGEIENRNAISYIQTTITSGFVSDNSANAEIFENNDGDGSSRYFIVSAPINVDMVGGGLFDSNGYLMGIIASKVASSKTEDEDSSSHYLSRVTLIYSSKHAMKYLQDASDRVKKDIHYFYAVSENSGGN